MSVRLFYYWSDAMPYETFKNNIEEDISYIDCGEDGTAAIFSSESGEEILGSTVEWDEFDSMGEEDGLHAVYHSLTTLMSDAEVANEAELIEIIDSIAMSE